jgi:hypothetical protein
MPSVYITKDGRRSVGVNMLIPEALRDKARAKGIPMSRTLIEALETRIGDLERAELAGAPAPGPTTATNEGAS